MEPGDPPQRRKLTLYQRMALRNVRRRAGRRDGEPMGAEDWAAMYELHDSGLSRAIHAVLRRLPRGPRCGLCGAPFAGPGARIARPLGYRPSRKSPVICSVCVELSPPGGTTMYTGVLFADLRGFTARFAGDDPEAVSKVLRRFYRCAEDVLFPEAMIDKLIGDQVMALYLPDIQRRVSRAEVPALMLEHARDLLAAVGYGSPEGPFVDLGIGIDVGDAFVGNIGERALYDFTAVGDVVNTASRLQGQAAGGEIVLSDRVAHALDAPVGIRVELELKGRPEPQAAYRVSA
jgi:adenylate cyclase